MKKINLWYSYQCKAGGNRLEKRANDEYCTYR